jgi:hypothetical protein
VLGIKHPEPTSEEPISPPETPDDLIDGVPGITHTEERLKQAVIDDLHGKAEKETAGISA